MEHMELDKKDFAFMLLSRNKARCASNVQEYFVVKCVLTLILLFI